MTTATPRRFSSTARWWLCSGFLVMILVTMLLLNVPFPLPWVTSGNIEILLLTAAVDWPGTPFERVAGVMLVWVLFLFFGMSAAASSLRGDSTPLPEGRRRSNRMLALVLASAAAVFCIGFVGRMSFLHY